MSDSTSSDSSTERLGDLIVAKYGKGLPQTKRRSGVVPVYGSNGVVGFHDEAITKGPTIIIGRKGSSGAVNLSPTACWPIDTTYFIDEPGPFSLDFLELLLRSLGLEQFDRSTAIPGLNRDDLYAIEVPVPDEARQAYIVRLVTTTRQLSTSARNHLTAGQRAIERFRQAVLAAACSGRLTADWRDAHGYESVPFHMLDGIRETRRGDRKALQPEELPAPEDEETPDTWLWVRFGSVIGELRNGVPIAPAMEPPGIPILRISAARPRRVDLGDLRYLRDDVVKWTPFLLRDGDLLFTRYNGSLSLLGVCGMVRGLGDRVILHPDKLMKVRFDHEFVEPEYVEIFFASPNARTRMTAGSVSSAGQQGISGATVKAQPIALPPLAEQREIIRRVNQLLQRADTLEARIDAASNRVDRSSQAVLAKAFRGDLTIEAE